jgi:hypothetical protein
VKHRICTDIALKIKELGFLGDCGYNQLLYPVEHQTRDLLKWIVDKLPRSTEEEGNDEILGANAILNRNITHSLMKWQKSLWSLPSCQSGKPLTNIYQKFSFSLNNSSNNFATRLINQHSLEKVKELRKTEELNRRFLQASEDNNTTGGKDDSKALMERILSSLRNSDDSLKAFGSSSSSSSMKGKGTATSSSTADNGTDDENVNLDGSSKSKTASQMNLTFQELIKSIQQEAAAKGNDNDDNHGDDYRGSRFAHATGLAFVIYF